MCKVRSTSESVLAPRAASRSGTHRNQGSSLSAFLSTLVPCFALAAVLVVIFLLLRKKQRGLYAPRTYHDVLSKEEKTPRASDSMLGWTKNFRHINDEYILNHHSLDAYLFVRFLKIIVFMSFVGCLITWPVLFPVNATGGGGESGFDILSFSNVNDPTRYFAHALVAWVFFGFVLFLIGREMLYLIKIRQAYLLSTLNASRISQRTVLFTNVPDHFHSHERLRSIFTSVSQIWLVSDTSDLEGDVDDMESTALKLEDAELKLVQETVKSQQKNGVRKPRSSASQEPTSWDRVLEPSKRPTHRLKPLIGSKVDSIEYGRRHLAEVLSKVQSAQRTHLAGKEKLVSAVFVEFETLAAAQSAYTTTIDGKPASFIPRQVGILPDEIIWKNLGMKGWDRSARHVVATATIAALILFWAIPVALVGIISNVDYLTDNVPFLRWIDSIPSVILGVVTGLLPTILLAALMALVPIICRLISKLAGAATLSEVEQQTQTWYFAFQVIQVFLITTFTSGATAVASQIVSDPTQAVPLLAKNLPKASNFYISYFVLYGVANAANYLFNLMGLLGVFVFSRFAKTPRKKYEKYVALAAPSWGSEYPKWTNMGVIAISYAIISPLVLGFSTVGMGLIYLAYRYNMLYVFDTLIDTKGASYARALQQLMVGVYLAELCLLGLFGIGVGDRTTAVGPVVLQIILIVATIAFHLGMRRKLHPLVETLPLDLLTKSEYRESDVDDNGKAERGERIDNYASQPQIRINDEDQYSDYQSGVTSGLVSSTRAHHSSRYHTHTAANDLANQSSLSHQQSIWKKLFIPHTQSVEFLSTSLAPHFRSPVPEYVDQDARQAYLNPAITAEAPILWLARDELGVSRKEVLNLRDALGKWGVVATDEGAIVDGKGKVQWINESVREAPLWEGRVFY